VNKNATSLFIQMFASLQWFFGLLSHLSEDIASLANHLATFASIVLVERRARAVLRNKWSRGLMQGGATPDYLTGANLIPFLTGKGEVNFE
jgi:hypothetical protein